MSASFLITLREGLEAFLLIGIILSYLDKMSARQYYKWIYIGVGIGVICSLGLAVMFQFVIDEFENETYQHYVMISILFFAVIVLTYMMIWMRDQAKNMGSQVQENLKELIDSKNLIGLVGLAFLAIVREGLETVLFFSALMYSSEGAVTLESGLTGAALGLIVSALMVYFMMKGAKNIPLGLFFKWSSLLILLIAAGLFSSAVNMLQAVEIVPTLITEIYNIAFILDDRGTFGTFLRALFGYNSSPTMIQFASWLTYLLFAMMFWRKAYNAR